MNRNRIFPLLLTISLVLSFFAGANQLPASAQPQAATATFLPELLGQAGGASLALTYEATGITGYGYLYLGIGPRLYIYWVDQNIVYGTPTLTLLGVSEPLPGIIQGIAMYYNLAYVTMGEEGFAIIDTGVNKTAPVILNTYDTPGFARGLWITSTKIVYIADGESGILILNVFDPNNITLLGSYNTDGNARSVIRAGDDLLGDLLYVADGEKGLLVLKVESTNTLSRLSAYDTANAEDVFFSNKQPNYLYLADGSAGLKVFFIKDPADLSIYRSMGPLVYAQSVMYYGGEIYIADGLGGLRVISCSDTGCIENGFFDTPGSASELAWAEKIVFIADTSGMRAIDANTPSAPFEVTTASRESLAVPGKLAAVGSTVYIADPWQGLRILDATNPAAPTLTGTYDSPGTAYDVAVTGSLAYLADGTGGLRLLDISEPTNPTEVNSFAPVPFADFRAVVVDGEVAFVANGVLGISAIIFDDDPFQTQQYILADPEDASDIALAGEYAYVADGTHGLVIIDRVPLGDMYQVGHVDTPGRALAVAVRGSYAYVADETAGLRIIDISDPASPVETGYLDTPGSAIDVYVDGILAYVADADGGLHVINITNPAAPTSLSVFATPGSASGVAASDSGLYVADLSGGLLIFTPPPELHAISLPLIVR